MAIHERCIDIFSPPLFLSIYTINSSYYMKPAMVAFIYSYFRYIRLAKIPAWRTINLKSVDVWNTDSLEVHLTGSAV